MAGERGVVYEQDCENRFPTHFAWSAVANTPDEQFVRLLTGSQNRLYAYVLTLLPDPVRARDVVQDANVVIWRKAAEFTPGTNFGAWACKIAYLEVLKARRKAGDRRVIFSDAVLEQVAETAAERTNGLDDRMRLLEACLEELTQQDRRAILERYQPGASIAQIAESLGKSTSATAVALFRTREKLLECIRLKLAAEDMP